MARSDNFNKFVKQPKAGAIKEKFRQEKKKEKKERAEAIERHFAKKREERLLQKGIVPTTTGPKKAGKFSKETPEAATPDKKFVKGKKPETTTDFKDKKGTKPAPATNAETKTEFKGKQPLVKETKFVKGAKPATSEKSTEEQMPLNKYIAHSGVCARRDAAILVKEGKVKVNDVVVTDPGTKVSEYDIVKVDGKKITPSKNLVYILLNKPKDFITTSEDPKGRRTVLDLVKHATTERIYPVGRLDRNTSGVLLITNDGDLAQKLSHPRHEVKKVYEVKLDRPVTKADIEQIASGVTLEDGFIAPDAVAYADAKDKSIIGIEIHSGKNRIVRRIFEHLKYDVKGLDRVMYAGLTKKDVQRGKWRFLKEKEIRILKFMNKSFLKETK